MIIRICPWCKAILKKLNWLQPLLKIQTEREESMRNLYQIIFGILLLADIAAAQVSGKPPARNPEQSWDNLRTLRVGEKVQLVDQKLRSQNGTFASVSDESITVQAGKDSVTIQRADVFRVSSRERGHSRGRNALIGLAVGGLGGLGLGVAMAASRAEGVPLAAELAGMPLFFGGIGAGVSAALPAGRPTIYWAERRKDQTAL